MARIVASANVTLDGVVQDPTGEEGFELGGWFARVSEADREAFGRAALEEALAAEAFLMGRRTYGFLSSRWPARTGPLADRLNSIAKYVVSSTLTVAEWTNTTVVTGEPAREIARLKERLDGQIVVPASFQLVRALIEHALLDELRLLVFPLVLGSGGRLFGESDRSLSLGLLDCRTAGGLALLTYAVHRSAPPGPRAGSQPTSSPG